MKKVDKQTLNPEVFDLYDKYVHNQLSRRNFIEKLSMYAVGGLTVPIILKNLLPDYTNSIQVEANDPRLISEMVSYDSPKGGGEMKGLLSRPKDQEETLPGIIVVHENRGLNPHIEDVARRAGLERFISFAPDALTPLGGYPGNDDDGRALQRKRDKKEMLEDFIAAFYFLKSNPNCNGHIGVVGFCFGGWISNMMAAHVPELGASVPFYGGQPSAEEVPAINVPLMVQLAGLDERVNAGWPDYEAALQANQKEFTLHFYPEVKHGFHNDTTPRYEKEAAALAWSRTIQFFKENLQ